MLLLVFFCPPLQAWNEDYAKSSFPDEKKVCLFKTTLENNEKSLRFHSVDADESCSEDEETYLFVKGSQPEGSLAFVPYTDRTSLMKDLELQKQDKKRFPNLNKFSCLGKRSFEILGSKAHQSVDLGEIYSPSQKQVCSDAYESALKACKTQLGGVEILERCY